MNRRTTAAALVAALVLGVGGVALASSMGNTHTGTVSTIRISPQNHSGQSGTATFVQHGNDVVVTLTMTGIPRGVAEPTHIHPGICSHLNPKPQYVLTNATDGTTRTTIHNLRLAILLWSPHAINVHDARNLAHYVACGDIR